MDDDRLIARLEALQPPDVEGSRERAVAAVSVRVRQRRSDTAPRRMRPLLVGLAAAFLAATVVALVALGGSSAEQPSRAYGAELIRFADSTPLLLLEAPGWRVQHLTQFKSREGTQGSMDFVTGKAVPYESIRISGSAKVQRESGMFPPAVRQRRVELSWRHESLAKALALQHETLHPHGERWVEMPVLDTSAQVDTRAEFYINQGGPGNREMVAIWQEGGWVLTLRAAVPDQAAFEERLGWLARVHSQAWLEAMPAAVVKAADFDGTVREMIRDIPLPKTFAISRVPDEGLTTNREAVGAKVAGTVSCLWLRQWGAAVNGGDTAAAREAVAAMATSRHWKILTEVESTNGYSPLVWEVADAMKKGYREWHGQKRKVLPYAEGLGCARFGLPLMAEKIKRQRARLR